MTFQQDKLKEKLLVFGAIEILSGTVILVLGVFLGSIQVIYNFFGDFSFFTFYTGYVIWGPVFFIITGSSSLAAGKDLRKILDDGMVGRYIVSAIIALAGFILLSANLALNNVWLEDCPFSPSPGLCLYMGTSNNGLMTLMLIFISLELCTAVSTVIKCREEYLHYWPGLMHFNRSSLQQDSGIQWRLSSSSSSRGVNSPILVGFSPANSSR